MANDPTLIRSATETLIRLVRQKVHANTVLIHPDDQFEVKNTPSVLLVGPTITEDRQRRTLARMIEETPADPEEEGSLPTFKVRQYPRLYNLDFEIVVTTSDGGDLLDFEEKVAAFFAANVVLSVPDRRGELGLTLIDPLGGYRRPNLSNLRQASGRFRVEDVPVYADAGFDAKVILTRIFEFRDGVNETVTRGPDD